MGKITKKVDPQKYAEANLSKVLNSIDRIYINKTEDIRQTIEKDVKTNLTPYANYMTKLLGAMTKSEIDFKTKQFRKFLKDMGGKTLPNGKVDPRVEADITTVMGAFNKLVPASQRINKGLKDSSGQIKGQDQQAHKDFTVLSAQAFIIYTKIQADIDNQRKTKVPVGGNADSADTNTNVKRELKPREQADLAEYFRQMWITAKAVADMPKSIYDGSNSYKSIENALNHYMNNTTQAQHEANKIKQVDILSGKASQKIEIEIQDDQSALEKLIGRSKFRKVQNRTQEKDYTNAIKNINFSRLKGSNPIEGEIVKQFTDLAAGKKPRKYSSKTKQRQKTKAKKDLKIRNELKPLIAASLALGAFKKVSRPKKATRQSESGVTNQRELNKLKLKINARLPAQVRRNMGRPALENRTGRFSNSAALTELRQGPKTLIGKYTYMLNPYQTFENEGPREWPTGFNPKPLIAQSIRDIALQYTKQKFTLRRD